MEVQSAVIAERDAQGRAVAGSRTLHLLLVGRADQYSRVSTHVEISNCETVSYSVDIKVASQQSDRDDPCGYREYRVRSAGQPCRVILPPVLSGRNIANHQEARVLIHS